MIRLSKEQVILLHEQLIAETGGAAGLAREEMLESALNAPFQSIGGTDAYPSLQQKATRLCYGLVKNHPFADGNKRLGRTLCWSFFLLMGLNCTYEQAELPSVILSLAAGEIGQAELLSWLLSHQA